MQLILLINIKQDRFRIRVRIRIREELMCMVVLDLINIFAITNYTIHEYIICYVLNFHFTKTFPQGFKKMILVHFKIVVYNKT